MLFFHVIDSSPRLVSSYLSDAISAAFFRAKVHGDGVPFKPITARKVLPQSQPSPPTKSPRPPEISPASKGRFLEAGGPR